jgi:hypothetical protein
MLQQDQQTLVLSRIRWRLNVIARRESAARVVDAGTEEGNDEADDGDTQPEDSFPDLLSSRYPLLPLQGVEKVKNIQSAMIARQCGYFRNYQRQLCFTGFHQDLVNFLEFLYCVDAHEPIPLESWPPPSLEVSVPVYVYTSITGSHTSQDPDIPFNPPYLRLHG